MLTKRIGGTSGPIWGTAFLRAGGSLSNPTRRGEEVVAALRAAIEGIKQRGNTDLGDKTLLDALVPAVDELEASLGEGAQTAMERAAVSARESAEATKGMLAMRGRASYTGERSRDSVDAGAIGIAVMFEAVSKAWQESEVERDRRSEVKKFVNDPQQFVPEMLKGIELANPGKLKYVPEYNLIMRTDAPRDDKVSIVQGSGSGHEPAHVMAVGPGMLDAACPGDVFAAPPSDYVYETTKLLASPKGVLHIINNYTGDRMAFDMGRELAEAEDIKIATIIVDDDVAVKDSTWTVGRRGVAGNFFVIKAVGAASEHGASLEELVELGNRVNSVTRTMGMALTSCTPPAKGSPLFDLGDDEMEMGVGIHGEPGRRREKLASADDDRRRAARGRRHGPPVPVGRRGRADDQRPRRHADLRAVHLLRPGRAAARRPGHQRHAQLRRRVLHVARHGRRLADAGQARRRAQRAVRRARRGGGADLLDGLWRTAPA